MKIKTYLTIWFLVFAAVGFEYYALNFKPSLSLLLSLQNKGMIRDSVKITADPGRTVSLWLGWLGLGLMIIMNVYSMRKRFSFMHGLGRLSSWLDFHVFCGLVGPTFILFHSNFKVRGIVGISFWSMVISFSSGIIGRYFYVQMLKAKVDFENESEKRKNQLKTLLEKKKVNFNDVEIQNTVHYALQFVGVRNVEEAVNPFSALIHSGIGDLRLAFSQPSVPKHWPSVSSHLVAEIALQKRRALFLESFQSLMGYWHTFHFPFAIFMYIAAVIHVASALIFGI